MYMCSSVVEHWSLNREVPGPKPYAGAGPLGNLCINHYHYTNSLGEDLKLPVLLLLILYTSAHMLS